MIWIAGRRIATSRKTTPLPQNTFHATLSVTATWTTTAPGANSPTTARFGDLTMSAPTGLLTATATGTGSALGAGPGSVTSRGVLLPTTMAAGTGLAGAGVGAPVRSGVGLSMVRPTSVFSAAGSASGLALAADMAGSPWVGVNRSAPGTIAAAATGAT